MIWDKEGRVTPGSLAIAVVSLGAWGKDGDPKPSVRSAVCDTCGAWASELWTAGETVTVDPTSFPETRVKRSTTVVVYSCPEHYLQIGDALVNEYGHAVNMYDPDQLAIKVSDSR